MTKGGKVDALKAPEQERDRKEKAYASEAICLLTIEVSPYSVRQAFPHSMPWSHSLAPPPPCPFSHE